MLQRCKGILFAVILGVILPGLVISMLQNKQKRQQETVPVDTQNKQTEAVVTNQISVLMNDGQIHQMNMVDYLTCVVLREMPASFEVEALKAQAVVARTYALRRSQTGGKHIGAAVSVNTECCQGYCDIDPYLEAAGDM